MQTNRKKAARRRLLKSAAVVSGGVGLGKTLPNTWSKPIVNSILLPAHASTTDAIGTLADAGTTQIPDVNPCVGESQTIGADQFAIDIVYDGVSTSYFSIRDTGSSRLPENTILGVSKAPNFAVGPDQNWETGDPRVENNIADGVYTRTTTRIIDGQSTGDTFEITFCIATSGEDASRTLTVTLVSIRRL